MHLICMYCSKLHFVICNHHFAVEKLFVTSLAPNVGQIELAEQS